MWGSEGWNQWALQPSMFNNVPHDEIDWAALAKQWIQMQKPGTEGEGAPVISSTTAAAQPPPPPHPIPMIMEDYSRDGLSPAAMNMDHQFATERPEIMNQPALLPNPVPAFRQHDVNDSYWHPEWEGGVPHDMDERVWGPPPPPPPPPVLMPSEKKTFDYGHVHDNPPLTMQTVDYNHVSEHYYNQMYVPPEDPYDQYWSQVGSAPVMPPTFLKKDRLNNFQSEEDTSHIDAAKRKQLPAWIREGLEKMEQERLKRLEKERAEKEQVELSKKHETEPQKKGLLASAECESSSISMPSKSKFESDSEDESESYPKVPPQVKTEFAPPVEETMTEEEKRQQLMLKVRRLLTEILLSVTNGEMAAIAKEVHLKALSKAPARPLATTLALRSIATGLNCLANYASHSDLSESDGEESDSSTSDEELRQRIQEKRKKFASKERKILAELEEAELKEKRSPLIAPDMQNPESVPDHLKNNKNLQQTKTESEIDNKNKLSNLDEKAPPSLSLVAAEVTPTPIIPLISDETSPPNHNPASTENSLVSKGDSSSENQTTGENNDSKVLSKKRESSSTSTDSESDSSSSSSSNRSSKRRKTNSSDKKGSRHLDTKYKKRDKSPKRKREKGRSSRREKSEDRHKDSKSLNTSKLKKRRSRSRKRKGKNRRQSDSSSSSSGSSKEKGHSNSGRSRHRSSSHDRHQRKRKSRSHSRQRSYSKSRHSRSRSRSRRESHYDSRHKHSGSSRYREESRKAKKDSKYSRSRSPSQTPKRYRPKSRSLSLDRNRQYKKSKIRSRDR